MARPMKEGLDYFPLDIDIDQDDKLVVPISKYGMQGLGIIVKIMMEIYRNGYFYNWGEREQYVFANKVNVDVNYTKEVINECIKWGFFNQKLYEAFGILTSRGFQKRYLEASKRRKNITFIDIYVLMDLEDAVKKMSNPIYVVDEDGNQVNVYINPDKCNEDLAETPQSKVNKSKVNKSKRNESKQEQVTVAESDDHLFAPLQPSETVDNSRNPDDINLFRLFETEGFGTVSPVIAEEMNELEKEYGNRWVAESMKNAVLAGKRKITYVRGTLVNWKADGKEEPWVQTTKPSGNKNSSNSYNRNVKPQIDTVPSVTDPNQSEVTEEQFEEMMRFAEQMQAAKSSEAGELK